MSYVIADNVDDDDDDTDVEYNADTDVEYNADDGDDSYDDGIADEEEEDVTHQMAMEGLFPQSPVANSCPAGCLLMLTTSSLWVAVRNCCLPAPLLYTTARAAAL